MIRQKKFELISCSFDPDDTFFDSFSGVLSLADLKKLHSLPNSMTHSLMQYGPRFNIIFYVLAEIHKWLKLLINVKILIDNLISNKGN